MEFTFSYDTKRKESGIEWILAEFPHGPLPRSIQAGEEDFGRSLGLTLSSVAEGVEVVLDHPESKMSYRGVAKKEENAPKYLVAVVDRKKRTARILPEDSGLEVSMVPKVKGFVPVQPEDHDDVNLGTYVREFASHREHKRLKDYADAYISANSLNVASEMNAARLKHKTELEEIKARVLEERPLVPRHDKETILPSDIYSIDGLVSRETQNTIVELMESRFGNAFVSEEAEILLEAIDSCDVSLKDFVEFSILEILKANDDEKRKRIVAFGFVLVMQVFLLSEHPMRREDKLKSHIFENNFDIFKRVRNDLNDVFGSKATNSNRIVLDAAARIRCFNYAVVGMLLISEKTIAKVDHICSLFGVIPSIAKRHLTSVGCKFVKTDTPSKTDVSYALKAPLVLPSMQQKGKRR